MSESKLKPEDFTIGILCALPIELSACCLVLDERYSSIKLPESRSQNAYLYGRIAEHNVVIACLPAGQYGTTPATRVVELLLGNFPAIRMGVFVGIGGGVPSEEHDIRLGDVVVSIPDRTYGGVVQHDTLKANSEGSKRIGFLNSPPYTFLTTITQIRTLDSLQVTKFRNMLQGIVNAWSMFRKPSSTDILAHQNHKYFETQNNCLACQEMGRRDQNKKRSGPEPVVHYGTIVSGNTLVQDAERRDELQKVFGCLCIEMEGAGVANSFPCLIVRGISNFCDTSKNDAWQGYASLAAATWTKELLCFVPGNAVRNSKTAKDIIQGRKG